MSGYLTSEWVDALVGGGTAHGPSLTVQVVVTGAPGGDVKWHARLVEGVIAEASVGTLTDADVSLTLTSADALAMLEGELDPNVAFMRGRMKTAGDPGRLFDLLAATATPDFRSWRAQVAATTDI